MPIHQQKKTQKHAKRAENTHVKGGVVVCHVRRTHGRINMERRRVRVGRRVKVGVCWRGLMRASVVRKPERRCCRHSGVELVGLM